MRETGRSGRSAGAAMGLAVGLLTFVSLTGCAAGEPATTIEQKQSADAKAAATAPSPVGARERVLPMLRTYHDQVSWPAGRDVSPDQMWAGIAPSAGQVILDEAAVEGEVGFINLCSWALTAIETVKTSGDTAEVRKGLLQSTKLMPGGESMSQEMADELVLGNVEKTQQFVTANKCDDDSG